MGARRQPLGQRLVDKIDVRGQDECWEWQGGQGSFGHGQFRVSDKRRCVGAHRVVYAIRHRLTLDELKGVIIRHVCHNPPCCNPAHLKAGTQAENIHDEIERGTFLQGLRGKPSPETDGVWRGGTRIERVSSADRIRSAIQQETDGCIEFDGCRMKYGHGSITFRGKHTLAHRFAYAEFHGIDINSAFMPAVIRHICDNPPCINPRHLLGGTQADNNRDASDRKRYPSRRGEQNVKAKLNSFSVRLLRAMHGAGGVTIDSLARYIGVSEAAARAAIKRRSWAHIP